MASIKTYTDNEKADARKAKFKRKRPTKPKVSSTLKQKEAWIKRYNIWVDALKAAAKKTKTKSSDKETASKLQDKISRV